MNISNRNDKEALEFNFQDFRLSKEIFVWLIYLYVPFFLRPSFALALISVGLISIPHSLQGCKTFIEGPNKRKKRGGAESWKVRG